MELTIRQVQLACVRCTVLSNIRSEWSEHEPFDKKNKKNGSNNKKNENSLQFQSSPVSYLGGVFNTRWGSSYLCHRSRTIGKPL